MQIVIFSGNAHQVPALSSGRTHPNEVIVNSPIGNNSPVIPREAVKAGWITDAKPT